MYKKGISLSSHAGAGPLPMYVMCQDILSENVHVPASVLESAIPFRAESVAK